MQGSRIRVEFANTAGRLIGGGKHQQPLQADYVLEYRNKRLAIVKAKARDLRYTEGVGQVTDYAGRLNIRYSYAVLSENSNRPTFMRHPGSSNEAIHQADRDIPAPLHLPE